MAPRPLLDINPYGYHGAEKTKLADFGGRRSWDQTSDLFGVTAASSR
jgi:hypothetical protein